MKHGKTPSLNQRLFISTLRLRGVNLNSDNWLVVKDNPEELHIVKKEGYKGVRIWSKKENCWKA
jgi:hypothetical protein